MARETPGYGWERKVLSIVSSSAGSPFSVSAGTVSAAELTTHAHIHSAANTVGPHARNWLSSIEASNESTSLAAISRRSAIALDRAAESAAARSSVASEIE